MSINLVIMESPAKAQTVKGYLGSNYKVVASMGHVRDLPKSSFGIDVEGDFAAHYIHIRGKGDLIESLKKDAKKAKTVYLATDPDREGEAIAWHLSETLGIPTEKIHRVCFNEITKDAVKKAIKEARPVDMSLVDSQQTRRILDRIVGYKLSPLLWKNVQSGLSAGRVQSVATRIIVEREREIDAFVPHAYYTVHAHCLDQGVDYVLNAVGEENGKGHFEDGKTADAIVRALNATPLTVTDVRTTQKQKKPSPPFTTSVLQQEAFRKLNFSSSKTMKLAQTLYEGVYLGGELGFTGLITYMRTDSVRVSVEAQNKARLLISEKYGSAYVPDEPRVYKVKASAQDAHEAIRPTNVAVEPSAVRDKLDGDLYLLYKIIWESFVASQMSDGVTETKTIEASADGHLFRVSDTRTVFPGFTALYQTSEDTPEDDEETTSLPDVKAGSVLTLTEAVKTEHFTEPPARYNEATLIKFLKDMDIGRPSTYATIVTTILSREYVKREGKSFVPTDLGYVITDMMNKHFASIMDYGFTADMEHRLDEIADGNLDMLTVLRTFWQDFSVLLEKAEQNIQKVEVPAESAGMTCDKCGAEMIIQNGRFGRFAACPNYPNCKNTKSLVDTTAPTVTSDAPACEKCGAPLVVKTGKFGNFYACSNYPNCDYTTVKPLDKRVVCPICQGKIVARLSRRRTLFYGCENYASCGFVSWDEPTVYVCPDCQGMLYRKKDTLVCHNTACNYAVKEEEKPV